MEQTELQQWNELVHSRILTMKAMLDRIEDCMATHLNGEEKWEYIKPIGMMISEAMMDISTNGITFSKPKEEWPHTSTPTTQEEQEVVNKTLERSIKKEPSRPNRK